MTRISAIAAAAALAASASGLAMTGAAWAQDRSSAPRGPMLDFAAIDTDGDGTLSRTELQARAEARFATADANGDGVLDREELLVIVPGHDRGPFRVFSVDPGAEAVERLLALMGATEAGQVDVSAVAARRVNMLLAVADSDHDAAISRAEADARAETHARRHDHNGRRGRGPQDGPGWGSRGGPGQGQGDEPHGGPDWGPQGHHHRGHGPDDARGPGAQQPEMPAPPPAAPGEMPPPGSPDQL
jgi:Ca2+-binding EF-hand superfamily protein